MDIRNLRAPQPAAALQSYRIEPEFGNFVFALHVNVRGLVTVSSIEKEPVRAFPEHGWHVPDSPSAGLQRLW